MPSQQSNPLSRPPLRRQGRRRRSCTRASRTRPCVDASSDARAAATIRPDHDAPSAAAATSSRYRIDRLSTRQGRRSGGGRASRIRSEPHCAPRAAALRRRRAPLHHRAEGRDGGRHADVRRGVADQAPAIRCLCAASRSARMVHCVELKPGRGAQIARSAGGSVQIVAREGAMRRCGCARARCAGFHVECRATHRRGRQRRAQPAQARQGRREALARHAADGARRRDEPGRPPARWRRGQDVRRPSSGVALGPADQGLQDPQEQAHGQDDRPPAQEDRRVWRLDRCHVRSRKVPSSTLHLMQRSRPPRRPTTGGRSRPGRGAR